MVALVNVVLFGVFLGILIRLYRRNSGVGCGCFGGWGGQRPVGAVVLLRGGTLFIACVVVAVDIIGATDTPEPLWRLEVGVVAKGVFWWCLAILLYLLLEASEAVFDNRRQNNS